MLCGDTEETEIVSFVSHTAKDDNQSVTSREII